MLLTEISLQKINACKMSQVKPFMEIVAQQQGLKLNRLSQYRKALKIVKLSILNN